ncbi:2970_t:CDS:2, partial [Cetraspora pellucida]
SFTSQVQKFGRLCTKYGYYIGSSWITRNSDWARINYSVLVYMEIDKYSNNRKHVPVFEMKSFYGNIKYYLKYKLNNEDHMLAYVKTIDHCVGFIKVDNLYYIVDNE